ncbi:MAG TPA: outer membrane protein assembly factor BamE [Rhizomicrobium sp.]|jgi:outer membrane protein assembly factor BamE (lipoprotein component of BamABCDE complex)
MRIRALLLIAVFAAAGCTPVISQRGYLADPANESALKEGKDTKTTVQARLGYPSTQGTFGGDSWYYISSTEKRVAFFEPRLISRTILAVYFDKDSKVNDLKHFGLKDGHVVDFETRETITRGREMTFLQQLFNATPGVPISGADQQNPGGGGPGPGH